MIEMEERRIEKMQRRQVQTCSLASTLPNTLYDRGAPLLCFAQRSCRRRFRQGSLFSPKKLRAYECSSNVETFGDLA